MLKNPPRLLLLSYYLLLFAGLVLPSDGNHGFLSFKSIAFISTFLGVGLDFYFKQKVTKDQLLEVSFFCFALLFLVFWLFVGLIRDKTPLLAQIDQFKLFFVTFTFPLMTLYLIREGIMRSEDFLKVVIYLSFIYLFAKLMLVSLYLMGYIDLWKWMSFLGFRFMSMKIYGILDRVQTSADIASPFLVFFVWQGYRLGVSFKPIFVFFYTILSALTTLLSFSRYLIFVYIASLALYCLTIHAYKFTKLFFIIFAGGIVAVPMIGPEKIHYIFDQRVLSKATLQSDEIRERQVRSLLSEYQKMPFLGKGMGGYAENDVRDSVLKHNYEVQWIAFLMQFGMFGLFLMCLPLIIIGCRLLKFSCSRIRLAFFFLFGLWLLSGFMNPFLISLTSGIIYTLFFLVDSMLLRETKRLQRKNVLQEKSL